MAFPQTPLDVLIELYVSGQWTDITEDVYTRDGIHISRGRSDEAGVVDPGKCSLTFNNRSGKYSPRNPLSPLYGLIGRNTPVRVSVPGGTSYLALDGDPDSYASTPDHASLRITGDLDIRAEIEANWYSSQPRNLIGRWDEVGHRSYLLRIENGSLYLYYGPGSDPTNTLFFAKVLPALPPRAAVRVTFDVDNGQGGCEVRHYWAPTMDGPWTLIGDAYTGAGVRSIYAGDAPLKVAPSDLTVEPNRLPFDGKGYRFEVRSGIDGTIIANPDFTAQAAGATSFADSAGRTWTLNGTAEISDRRIRFTGEIPSWPARWDVSGKDVHVPIEAAGILRRLGQGAKALESTLRRRIPSFNPVAYWPMEEGANATRCYSPIPGVRPLKVSGFDMANDDSLAGSKPLPSVKGGALLSGTVPAPTVTPSPNQWHVEFLCYLAADAAPTDPRTILYWLSTGTVRRWRLMVMASGPTIHGYDDDDNEIVTHLIAYPEITGRWMRWKVWATQSGSTVNYNIQWTTVGVSAVGSSGSYTGTVGRISGVEGPEPYSADLNGLKIGHLGVFTQANTFAYNDGDIAFAGETAGERMLRLAEEENLPLLQHGYTAEQEQVGPQLPDSALALVEEAADVDGGILYERRDALGLIYRDRNSLYNQAPALELDYTADGEVAPPLEPVDDDQQVRNDRTVQRSGGATARAVLDTGALSVQAPPDGVGVYDDSVTLNLYDDTQPAQHAGWRLHLGTWDEPRYPALNINLAAAPHLIDAVCEIDSGSRITIAGVPTALVGPGLVDLLAQGYTEVLGHPNDWDVQINSTPAGPWAVAEASLVEDFEDTDYQVTLTSGGNLPWARSSAHYNTGTTSLRSGAISNNQTSDAIVTVPADATEMAFSYWTSSEASGPGFEGDRLLVLVDGMQVLRAQGTTAWTRTSINVTGATAVTFRYAKDNSSSSGEDAVHIDDLAFTRRGVDRVDTDGCTLNGSLSSTSTIVNVTTAVGETPWVDSAAHPEDFPFDVRVGGEVMTVTSCTGTALSQTFGVIRSVNGIVKAHASGTAVRLARPAITAL